MYENDLEKVWTILIYANGNNELEPEIYNAFEKVKELNIGEDVNIVFQLARAEQTLVETIRPNAKINYDEEWTGTRRYLISSGGAEQILDMGTLNMADPQTLYDFISWGMTKYPSKKTMVILSGHGAGFIGAMTDFANSIPYMMSFDGLTNAIYKSYKTTGKCIDCLVLDVCYMYGVELWHDMSVIPLEIIKYLLVTDCNIPLEGLPYSQIIKYLNENINYKISLKEELMNTTKAFNKENKNYNKLLLIDLDKKHFMKLKEEINNLAQIIIKYNINIFQEIINLCGKKPEDPFISLVDVNGILNIKLKDVYKENNNIMQILKNLIVCPHINTLEKGKNKGPSLYMPESLNHYMEFRKEYENLIFSWKSKWTYIIERKTSKDVIIESRLTKEDETYNKNYDYLPLPIILNLKYVLGATLEQNPGFTLEDGVEVLRKLGWY